MTICKIWLRPITSFLVIMLCLCSQSAFCQNAFEKELKEQIDLFLAPKPDALPIQEKPQVGQGVLFPSDAPGAILTPTGFGGYGTYIFGGIGAVYPEVYVKNKADLIASAGFCVGDPTEFVNFAASLNMTDVHRLQNFSGNFIVSRVLFDGTSISAGALQMFASKKYSDAPGSTFYMAISHSVQTIPSLTPGSSRLTYTIGLGSGRFYEKSPFDIKHGKGAHGTAVFGSVSFEIIRHVNVNAEWTGMNLALTTGVRPFKTPVSFGIGLANITRYSSDKANVVFSLGYPLSLSRH